MNRGDFVQVAYSIRLPDDIVETKWRNALYVEKTQYGHVVQYTDGTKEELHRGQQIRKAQ